MIYLIITSSANSVKNKYHLLHREDIIEKAKSF